MKKEAEAMVREILHAYNRRVEPNDLAACYAIAEQRLLKLTEDPGFKGAELVIPPGTYKVTKAIVLPVAK